LEDEFDISFEPEEIAVMRDIATIEQMIQQKH
jgi:acyl carrier protein